MFKRDWLKKRAMKTRQPNDYKSHKSQKKFVDKGVVKAKNDYFRKQIEQSSGDQRATWTVLNDLMGNKSDSIAERIAKCLNNHFANVGPRFTSEIPTMANTVDPLDILKGINSKFFLKKVKSSDILMKLNRSGVNIAKATGHHKISNQLLKLAAPVIS